MRQEGEGWCGGFVLELDSPAFGGAVLFNGACKLVATGWCLFSPRYSLANVKGVILVATHSHQPSDFQGVASGRPREPLLREAGGLLGAGLERGVCGSSRGVPRPGVCLRLLSVDGACLVGRDSCLPWPAELHVGITKRLKTVEVLEGESCSFECILSREDTGDVAEWTVSGKTVGSSGRFCATRQGRKYTLAIRDAVPSDAGEVVFSVRGLTSKASLIVKGG